MIGLSIARTAVVGKSPVPRRKSSLLARAVAMPRVICYAKSHLLAGLLRANGIPAAFVYQRLRLNDDGPLFCLHGLNGAYLPDIG